VPAECGFHLLALVQPEQAMVHEDAGEPVTDGPVHQHGRHRRIHSTGEPADHALIPRHELPDPPDFGLDEMPRRPVRRAPADLEQEVVEQLATPGRVRHLGMELHSVQRLDPVLHRRHG
jgi:hypothetical protein